MRVIHLSGIPGAGKTTLGQKFAALEGIVVVETDGLLTEEDLEELRKLSGTGSFDETHIPRIEAWKAMFIRVLRKEYYEAIEKGARVILFVGILDQHARSPGAIVEMPFADIDKLFLKVPLRQLLRQFYSRYTKELYKDEEFWEGVETGRYKIPSSRTFLASVDVQEKWHREHGYVTANPDMVEAIVMEALNLHQARPHMGWTGQSAGQ
jgi:gluconate kinase